jgi:hypothetical protein
MASDLLPGDVVRYRDCMVIHDSLKKQIILDFWKVAGERPQMMNLNKLSDFY